MTNPRLVLFGKLPSHGDFVTRGLSAEALALWDAWASSEIQAARELLGPDFDDAHDGTAPFRFIGSGSAASTCLAGAITPSIDKVGRRYLAMAGFDHLDAAQTQGASLAALAENVLTQAIIADWTVDRLMTELAVALENARKDNQAHEGATASGDENDVPPVVFDSPFSGLLRDRLTSMARGAT